MLNLCFPLLNLLTPNRELAFKTEIELYKIVDSYFQEDDPHQRLLLEAIKNDALRKMEKEKVASAERTILTAAKLIAPVIEATFAVGFDWCIEQVKVCQYSELSNELEVSKGLTYLKQKDIPKVSYDCNQISVFHL